MFKSVKVSVLDDVTKSLKLSTLSCVDKSSNSFSPIADCIKFELVVTVPNLSRIPDEPCVNYDIRSVSDIVPLIKTPDADAIDIDERVELSICIRVPTLVCKDIADIVLAPTSVPAAADDETAKPVIDAESSSTLLTLLIGFSDKALKPSISLLLLL